MFNIFEDIRVLQGLGLRLIPIKNNKMPVEQGWQQTGYGIEEFIEKFKDNNLVKAVGILTGKGLLAIDVDGAKAFTKAQELSGLEDPFGQTIKFTSGKPDRFQAIYRIPEDWDNIKNKPINCETGDKKDIQQLDFRYEGRQSVIIGEHPETGFYKWIEGSSPAETEIAVCPNWVKEFFDKESEEEVKPNLPTLFTPETPKSIPLENLCSVNNRDIIKCGVSSGGRNNTLTALVRDLLGCESWCRSTGVDFTGTARGLLEEANSRCNPPVSAQELDTIWKSGLKDNPKPCLDEDKLLACLDSWLKPKKQYNIEPILTTPGETQEVQANIWEAPVSYNGELGFWVMKKIPRSYKDVSGKTIYEKDEKDELIFDKVRVFEPKADFDFDVVDYLEDENGGAYVFSLKQTRNIRKSILIKTVDTTVLKDLKQALDKAYGVRLTCNLKMEEINSFIYVRTQEYYDKGGKRHLLAPCRGEQPNGFWVFEDIQYTPDGEVCTSEESNTVYNPIYGDGDDIPSPKILPPNPEILGKVLRSARDYLGDTAFMPAFFIIAAQVAGLYYQTIHKLEGKFPIVNATGDPGTGKSYATEIAQSFVGFRHGAGAVATASESAMYEWLKRLSGITLTIDDPKKDPVIEETFKGLFNGKARVRRGNRQEPRSSVIITSNHPIGESSGATLSRVASIPFFKAEGIKLDKKKELEELLDQASGAFSTLLKIGYNRDKVADLTQEFFTLLPAAHRRVADSLGLLTYYALQLAPFAGLNDYQVRHYAVNSLCKTANQAASNKDSLSDFCDCLETLHSRGLIGEWDYRTDIKGKKPREDGTYPEYIGFVMPSVWKLVTQNFSISYGQGTIKDLVSENGGKVDAVHSFAISKDIQKAYESKRLDKDSNLNEPERKSRRCFIIPKEYFEPKNAPENIVAALEDLLPEVASRITPDTELPIPIEEIEVTPIQEKIQPKIEEEFSQIYKEIPVDVKCLQKRLAEITLKEEYFDIRKEFDNNNSEVKNVFELAWVGLESHIVEKIYALCADVIPQVKHFHKFNVPEWCPFVPGELVTYEDKQYWFSGISQYAELTPKQKQQEGINWITLQEIKSKLEINANVQEVKPWTLGVNTE